MKLLTNENIPLSSVNILVKEGFDVLAVGQGFSGFLDDEVMELAIGQKQRFLLLLNKRKNQKLCEPYN